MRSNRRGLSLYWLFEHKRYLCSIPLLLVLVAVVLSACTQSSPTTTSNVDQSTPEATVHSMYDAFSRGDIQSLQAVLDMEAEENKLLVSGFKAGLAAGASSSIVVVEVQIISNDGKIAKVHTRVEQKLLLKAQVISEGISGEWLTLVKKNGQWYVRGKSEPLSP